MFSDYPLIAKSIYSFNIDVIDGDAGFAKSDERIGLTIVEIIKNFFLGRENVAVYVCDSADTRHLARKRKFDFWFWKYNDGTIIKEDDIAVVEDVQILNSLIIHKNNPSLSEIILAFKELNEKVNEK